MIPRWENNDTYIFQNYYNNLLRIPIRTPRKCFHAKDNRSISIEEEMHKIAKKKF